MRVLIVGLGVQGRKRMAVAGGDVVAAVDPVQSGAPYQRIEQVPLDAFDAACVCTPDAVKVDIATYLLSHDKHVLVEKPLVADDDRVLRRLAELVRANGVGCYTAYNHRFEPHLVTLKSLLDDGALGTVYLVRGFYGNGTARDVRNSLWRDQGLGVLADLGSHLLDLGLFYFGRPAGDPVVWSCNRFENRAPDHVLFGFAGRPLFEFEGTLLSWRNSFRFDVFGELGSAHVEGLCKWGPSTLTVRRRVLPSGRPPEESRPLEQPDPTWAAEYGHFLNLCRTGGSNIENDIWINGILNDMARRLGVMRPLAGGGAETASAGDRLRR